MGVPVIPLRFLSNERTSFYSDLIGSDMNMSTSFTWPTWPSWPAWPVKLATLFLFLSKFVESIAVGTSLNIVIWCRNVNGSKPTSRTSYHCNCIFVLYFDAKPPKIAGMSCDWGELSIHLIYFAKFQVLRKKKISQKRDLAGFFKELSSRGDNENQLSRVVDSRFPTEVSASQSFNHGISTNP